MGDPIPKLGRVRAKALVAFLETTDGEYVAKLPARVGALPYVRACSYGGVVVRSITPDSVEPTQEHHTRTEIIDRLADERSVVVKHRSETPEDIWGTSTTPARDEWHNHALDALHKLRAASSRTDDPAALSDLATARDAVCHALDREYGNLPADSEGDTDK